ncbi:protein kinase domain-containing protein [Yinghuangia seranimata]|uniref:protein kinase domain-containing protein n=1 Tax=Yinghuangia seranimata TaxID=408067 RepID=UPI00248C9304|nr:protein kinase [Yinghuangia seranimata]MDI2131919.1 protein kinase [Yinghuangia seranimata]
MGQPQRPDDDVSGTKLRTVGAGRYELGRQLGRGGMAEVSMAHDVRLGRTVAVKTLRPDLAQDPVARSRFGREAQNAASLNHPAIVSVYDTGEDRVGEELVPFIVMECVEGRTVRELLSAGAPIPQEQALRITEGVLEALEYSHRNGIIHRDIKPANVIITNSGAVKVMDFGIARALHSAATTMTQTGMVMGTPQYLSPEQALGRTVDARSDLYSSGCLLYELLALRPPFNGDTPLSVVYQHVQDDPRPPSASDARIPPHLDAIALKALAKNPDDRYQTAEEMRMDLRRALAGQTVHVQAPTGRIPAQPPTGTTRQAWAPGVSPTAPTARIAGGPAQGRNSDLEATTLVPPGHRTLPANDGGTGAMPVVSEPRRRRGGGFYVLVAAAVVAVIAGVTILVLALTNKNDADEGGSGGQTPNTGTSPSTQLPTETSNDNPFPGGNQLPSSKPSLTGGRVTTQAQQPSPSTATTWQSQSPTATSKSSSPTATSKQSTTSASTTSAAPTQTTPSSAPPPAGNPSTR